MGDLVAIQTLITAYLLMVEDPWDAWDWAQEINAGPGWTFWLPASSSSQAVCREGVRLSDNALQQACWLAAFGCESKPEWDLDGQVSGGALLA